MLSAVGRISLQFASIISKQSRIKTLNYNKLLPITNTARYYSQESSTGNEENAENPEDSSKKIDPEKDRTKAIPVEKSIKYLKSAAYQETYGDHLVWEQYRRNHKGAIPPRKTRKTCIRKGQLSTGNPCPICRDEYLVLHHQNIDLLKQFISPQTGEVLSYTKTGLCQKRHLELLVAVERAQDYGLLRYDVPFREYDYSEYYSYLKKKDEN